MARGGGRATRRASREQQAPKGHMSHLHIPDGVLPWRVWVAAWLAALVVLGLAALASRRATPQQIAWRGTLGALVLAAMTLELPLGAIDYHLSLLGVLGVLA